MAVLSLPLSFSNSFWSQDYRRGLETLFGKLEQVQGFLPLHFIILASDIFYDRVSQRMMRLLPLYEYVLSFA